MRPAPGTGVSYVNSGYILLGIIIEGLTGKRCQEFVKETIFAPIAMNRSLCFALNKLPDKTAWGYIEEEEGWRTNIYVAPIVGASDGEAFTTVHGLLTWLVEQRCLC